MCIFISYPFIDQIFHESGQIYAKFAHVLPFILCIAKKVIFIAERYIVITSEIMVESTVHSKTPHTRLS